MSGAEEAELCSEEGVEFIHEGGIGSEARVDVELRTRFPGIGGTIDTYQAIAVARRNEFSTAPNIGHEMFLRHALIKKLEDYFFKKGFYRYAHVTRPLGSTDQTYIYEWAFGRDGFPWSYLNETGDSVSVQLDDWNAFSSIFLEAGIDLQSDCSNPDNGALSQNIVHQLHLGANASNPTLNRLWKRIDFGPRSIRLDCESLFDYLRKNEQHIRETLRVGRYDMMLLACKHLVKRGAIAPKEHERLNMLVLDYRLSTLAFLNARGVGEGSTREIRFQPKAT
ncbi:hypothetical protein [[Eubacterium] cellulosolvens]